MSVSGAGGIGGPDWDAIFGTAEAAPPEAPAFDPAERPALAAGGRNDPAEVKRLQESISLWRGLRGEPTIAADGGFGNGTKAAVTDFQTRSGLKPTGVVDADTWSALAAATARPPEGPRAAETFPVRAQGVTNADTARLEAAWKGVPGTTSVTKLPGNGDRPVAVHLPPGFDPSKPARVVTLFHGHGWDVGPALGSKGDKGGVLARLKQLGADDPQTVFVFPQAGVKVPFDAWMKPPESFRALTEQALGEAARLAGAPSIEVRERTVDAHSGGGLALKNAINSGELVADKVNMLDCAYKDFAQTIGRWAAAHRFAHKPTVEAWYTNHDPQIPNHAQLKSIAGDLVTAHPIGSGDLHNTVPSRYFGTGPK